MRGRTDARGPRAQVAVRPEVSEHEAAQFLVRSPASLPAASRAASARPAARCGLAAPGQAGD